MLHNRMDNGEYDEVLQELFNLIIKYEKEFKYEGIGGI